MVRRPWSPARGFAENAAAAFLETVMIDGTKNQDDTLSGFDIVDGRQLPADATLRLDRDSVVVNTDNKQKRFSLDSAKRPRKTALIAAGVVIALLLVAAGGLAAVYFGGWGGGQDKEPIAVSGVDDKAPAEEPSKSDDPSSEPGKDPAEGSQTESDAPSAKIDDKSQVKLTEAEIFNSLDAAYGKLSVYDDRIATCVEEFNANFLANSMDARAPLPKKIADKVLSDLQEDLKGLEAVHIPPQSAYAEQAKAVAELYECQIGPRERHDERLGARRDFREALCAQGRDPGGVYAGQGEGAPCPLRRALRRLETLEGFLRAPFERRHTGSMSRPLPKRAAFFIILLDESL